jgi:GNAT superfamily N-acetyltransferase
MQVREGTRADWLGLAGFHYRSHNLGAVRKIFALKRGEELCGVIVYAYPPPTSHGRAIVLPKMAIRDLNKQLCSISRVVIHPKYRTIGLGALLIRQTLPLAGTPNVEMSAVMAKYNPFGEKAGMRRIVLQQPSRDAIRVSEALNELGFSPQLLGSQKYVITKLASLNPDQMRGLREAFCRNMHPRYMKEFKTGKIFGSKKVVEAAIQKAELPKLAQLIKITGLLLQTKAYLFWSETEKGGSGLSAVPD